MIATSTFEEQRPPVKAGGEMFGIYSQDPGCYRLEGDLSFASASLALKKTVGFFVGPATVVFDLAGIAKADSAGLALLLEWLRESNQAGVELHYVNLPRQLLAMAHVAGVDGILTIDNP